MSKTVTIPVKPASTRTRQWGFLSSVAVLLPFVVGAAYLSAHLHYSLPTPITTPFAPDGTPVFNEAKAMEYIRDLSTHADGSPKYRIVGTEEMVETDRYLLAAVEKIKEDVVLNMGDLHQIEVWHQVGTGTHLFDFMGKKVWKQYTNITNVVVRLSDGTPEGKKNAVLVNAHTDSTLPSPGAADDLVGVATMLETIRVMAMSPRRLTNAVVFLFNGAEESLQDASHMYITQHSTRNTIKSVINLEACGVGGPEIVFQATSEEMIRALAHTPRPYGTVLATEVFSSGLIVSDTDFRQFAQYGNLTGLDMALVQNSYLYHTRLDLHEFIEPGALQHMGENTIALLEYLTSNATKLGNSPNAPRLPHAASSETIYFSGLGGLLFVIYTKAQATVFYGTLAAISAILVSSRVDWKRRSLYLAGYIGIGASLVGALIGANLAAFAGAIVMNKSLTWFRHEHLPLLVYGPSAFLGAALTQRTISNLYRTPFATPAQELQESSLLEHAALVGQVVHYALLTLLGHSVGLGSSYLFGVCSLQSIVALLLNDYVLSPGQRRVHLLTYFFGQASPLLLGVEGLIGLLDLFVPLTGRMGAEAPADFIIASLTTAVGFMAVPMFLPFIHRFGPIATSRIAIFLTFATAGSLGWFTRPSWNVFDAAHPKRLLVLHMENQTTTPPEFHLHIASIDGTPSLDLIVDSTKSLSAENAVPVNVASSDYNPDWIILYPISSFMNNFKVPLPPTPSSYQSPWGEFTVFADKSVLNSVKRTRSLDIVMTHPSLIWPVIAFEADVVKWSLPEPAERGSIRHHVKSVAGWGVSEFVLSVVIELTKEQFDAAVRENQREKGQRADVSTEDMHLGRLKIDYSGLDRNGMFPASSRHEEVPGAPFKPGMSFFKEFDQRLPPEVDAMLLSAVAGVAYI
ncbi:hypothetical protein T439DRAFT_320338 [Meredithblackwellia eburnea MCA 4105]